MRVAIVDDEIIFTDKLYSELRIIINRFTNNFEIYSFCDSRQFLIAMQNQKFDIIFLDIDMPKFSGFDIAEKARNNSLETKIIFISAKEELVFSSFEYQPFYFLCKKSWNELSDEILHVVKKFFSLPEFRQNKTITIRTPITEVHVNAKDIICIMSEKHYIYYIINNHKQNIKERNSITNIEKELLNIDFVKVHQRYLVNMNYILSIDSYLNTIVTKNNMRIPISNKYKQATYTSYGVFLRK